jgi:DNA-binding NarL/FixJ family response regulator
LWAQRGRYSDRTLDKTATLGVPVQIRLLTIDSHTLVRMGVAHAVASHADIELVGEASTATEARELVATLRPNVITVDAMLPDYDGLALAHELRTQFPDLGVVVLAAANDTLLFRALEAGMSSFVPRSAPANEVVAGIRHAAVAGTSFSAQGLAEAVARRHRPQGALLSVREQEVLRLMRDGATVPRMAVALTVSESTVKTYVSRVYNKLQVCNRSQALMAAIQRGLLTEADAFAGSLR